MDDSILPLGAAGPPAPAPCNPAEHDRNPPDPDVVPLRLVLQPSGMVVEVKRADTLVGRHSSADVRLPLPDVSRRHCRLVWADGCWQVFDLNSLNGVFVNGERVRQATLRHCDLLRLGGFTFQVDTQPMAETLQLPPAQPRKSDGVLRSIADALPHSDGDGQQNRRAS